MIRVLCIDDSNKPNIIPKSSWVEKDKEYKVIHVSTSLHVKSKNVLMFSLAEIDLTIYPPYGAFRADRFAVHQDDIEALIALAEACTELNNVDISALVGELDTVN